MPGDKGRNTLEPGSLRDEVITRRVTGYLRRN